MIRLYLICEGATEKLFANTVLRDHLLQRQIDLRASKIGRQGHKGGCVTCERICRDVKGRLCSDRQSFCSVLVDFYGLQTAFPGKAQALSKTLIATKAELVSTALARKLASDLGDDIVRRFVPYVQMYEFEGLLFSNPEKLANAIGQAAIALHLQAIRDQFETPEHINDSPQTAPSKRILNVFDAYDKPRHGAIAAGQIGLAGIRGQCPLFDAWIGRLESLASALNHPSS